MSAHAAILNDVQRAISARAVADRAALVRHVTDLFLVNAAGLPEDDVVQFDDVLNELIAEIDTAARALLALRLSKVDNAPMRLMRTLACDDEPDVACPVLRQSTRLDDPALVAVATQKGQEHLFAIAQRPTVSETVTDVLVVRGDAQVLMSVAGNHGARFSERGFERLVVRAEGNDALARRIGHRKDIPQRVLAQLILTASEHVRASLQAELPSAAREIGQAVQTATTHVAQQRESAARDIDAILASVEELHRDGQLDDEQIRSFAEDGLLEEVKISLSLTSKLPPAFVCQALRQEGGETLVVIARGTGLSWSTVKAILRLPIWKRPATAGEIRHCLARYEKLSRATAADIMKFYKARQ